MPSTTMFDPPEMVSCLVAGMVAVTSNTDAPAPTAYIKPWGLPPTTRTAAPALELMIGWKLPQKQFDNCSVEAPLATMVLGPLTASDKPVMLVVPEGTSEGIT